MANAGMNPGRVIGHTKSGKPVRYPTFSACGFNNSKVAIRAYLMRTAYDFTKQDHEDASKIHIKRGWVSLAAAHRKKAGGGPLKLAG